MVCFSYTNINTAEKVNINSLINTNIEFCKGNEAVCDQGGFLTMKLVGTGEEHWEK